MIGVLAFCLVFEHWSIADASYLSVTTFTTVGTRDVTPSTFGGQVFTCIYALGGIGCLGICITTLGSNLITAELQAVKMAERESRKRVMNMFEGLPSTLAEESLDGDVEEITASSELELPESTSNKDLELEPIRLENTLRQTVVKSVPAFSFLFAGGWIMAMLEGWELPKALYYSVVTAGTMVGHCFVAC